MQVRDRHGNPVVRGPEDCAPVEVLWRDDTAVVVHKPSGMLVHNSAFAGRPEHTLMQAVPALVGHEVHAVHRLDRGTSGVVLLATAREHVARWQAALQAPTAIKAYLALVRGRPQQALDVDHPLADDQGVVREARSRIEPLLHSPVDRCALVRVTLDTGRWRQARRHLKHVSHPVLGDAEYGKGPLNRQFRADWGLERLGLHAWALVATHPWTGKSISWICPPPPDLRLPIERLFPMDELAHALGAPTSDLHIA